MKIIFSPKCLEYHAFGHPESPTRVKSCLEFLKKKNFEFIEPSIASEKDLLLVHTPRLIDEVKNEKISDLDTPNIKGIFNYALLAVGGAIMAMEIALGGEKAFSLMRPPGHHAGQDFCGGFCYFNNIALAVRKSLERIKRVAILDLDCHHGNGTEDIFLGKQNVLYISLHQSPLYPGTGLEPYLNCLNFPLPPKTEEKEYLTTLDLALKKISEFSPQLLAISAGFDTYKKDPLTYFGLEKESFRKIGQKISRFNLPTFAVLEGGYSRDLPSCLYNFLIGLENA
ncbi:MAG: histone deacetylase family protein [Patescibacteria group bacterium]|nr:histone deacetylase family protein [Patescibacteria group bacterium]